MEDNVTVVGSYFKVVFGSACFSGLHTRDIFWKPIPRAAQKYHFLY